MHIEYFGSSGSMQTSLSPSNQVISLFLTWIPLTLRCKEGRLRPNPHGELRGTGFERSQWSVFEAANESEAAGAQCETSDENFIEGLHLGRAATGKDWVLEAWVQQGDGQDQRFWLGAGRWEGS